MSTGAISFQYLAEIAVGDTARVDLCRSAGGPRAGQLLAVKRLHPHIAEQPAFVNQFMDEVWMTAALRHPNVVEVAGWGTDEHGMYLAVELVQGVSLARLMKTVFETGEMFTERMVVFIASCLCRGLAAAHSLRGPDGDPLNLVHRDLTPGNVLVGFNGDVKIADFGLAKAKLRLTQTVTGVRKGLPQYMAPELSRAKREIDGRADLFALGVMLFELFAGRPPWVASTNFEMVHVTMTQPPADLRELRPKIDKELVTVVSRCLEKDPNARFRSAEEVLARLDNWLGAHGYTEGNEDTLARFVRRNAMRQMRWFERAVSGEMVPPAEAGSTTSGGGAWPRRPPVPIPSVITSGPIVHVGALRTEPSTQRSPEKPQRPPESETTPKFSTPAARRQASPGQRTASPISDDIVEDRRIPPPPVTEEINEIEEEDDDPNEDQPTLPIKSAMLAARVAASGASDAGNVPPGVAGGQVAGPRVEVPLPGIHAGSPLPAPLPPTPPVAALVSSAPPPAPAPAPAPPPLSGPSLPTPESETRPRATAAEAAWAPEAPRAEHRTHQEAWPMEDASREAPSSRDAARLVAQAQAAAALGLPDPPSTKEALRAEADRIVFAAARIEEEARLAAEQAERRALLAKIADRAAAIAAEAVNLLATSSFAEASRLFEEARALDRQIRQEAASMPSSISVLPPPVFGPPPASTRSPALVASAGAAAPLNQSPPPGPVWAGRMPPLNPALQGGVGAPRGDGPDDFGAKLRPTFFGVPPPVVVAAAAGLVVFIVVLWIVLG